VENTTISSYNNWITYWWRVQ